jgi:hypothetical protein
LLRAPPPSRGRHQPLRRLHQSPLPPRQSPLSLLHFLFPLFAKEVPYHADVERSHRNPPRRRRHAGPGLPDIPCSRHAMRPGSPASGTGLHITRPSHPEVRPPAAKSGNACSSLRIVCGRRQLRSGVANRQA